MRDRSNQGGMVTAETAAAIPALMVVLAAAIWVLAAVGARIACIDAAHGAARAAARGEAIAEVRAAAQEAAPTDATVTITRDGSRVRVLVRTRVHPLGGLLSAVPAIAVRGGAVADVEGVRR